MEAVVWIPSLKCLEYASPFKTNAQIVITFNIVKKAAVILSEALLLVLPFL